MHIQVIGGGSWGLAIARLLALNEHQVRVWMREEDHPDEVRRTRESKPYLPGVHLPESIEIDTTVDPEAEMAIWAVPSHVMRMMNERFPLGEKTIRVSVAKGIENETLLRMSEVIEQAGSGGPIVSLSGPTHAEEVARDLPASIVAASTDEAARNAVQQAFFRDTFRVYTSPDIVGVELGGSLKNVIAIAAGACDGLEIGDNAKAALLARGLAEMTRLGVACGADPLTFAGLSGLGDLFTTCASRHSRNRRLGEQIAKGKTLEEITGASPMVAEGVRTTRSARALADKMDVDLPITNEVYEVLFNGKDVRAALLSLMTRDAKPERTE
jgi:glycerol-3-phosphate dehydrogenase (NAD(P)+)